MNNEISLNHELYTSGLDECLKGIYQFKGVLYKNICDGSSIFIPNGFWDYIITFIGIAMLIAIVLILLRIAFD